jgi:hypothetical protein
MKQSLIARRSAAGGANGSARERASYRLSRFMRRGLRAAWWSN